MRITVNGDPMEIPESSRLVDLLARLKLRPELVVVELNRDILKRADLDEVHLKEGDRLEVVQIVGGGSCSGRDESEGFEDPEILFRWNAKETQMKETGKNFKE